MRRRTDSAHALARHAGRSDPSCANRSRPLLKPLSTLPVSNSRPVVMSCVARVEQCVTVFPRSGPRVLARRRPWRSSPAWAPSCSNAEPPRRALLHRLHRQPARNHRRRRRTSRCRLRSPASAVVRSDLPPPPGAIAIAGLPARREPPATPRTAGGSGMDRRRRHGDHRRARREPRHARHQVRRPVRRDRSAPTSSKPGADHARAASSSSRAASRCAGQPVAGPEPLPTPSSSRSPAAAGVRGQGRRRHRTSSQPGETLYGIARAAGVKVERHRRAERPRQPEPLRVGQTLKLPNGAAPLPQTDRSAAAPNDAAQPSARRRSRSAR